MRYKNVLYSPDPPYLFGELEGGGLGTRLLHVMCTSSVVQSTSVGNLISVHAGVQVLVVAAIDAHYKVVIICDVVNSRGTNHHEMQIVN